MNEPSWVVAVAVLVAGVLSGFALAVLTRRREAAGPPPDHALTARLTELRARRAQLIEQLRLAGAEGVDLTERAALERDAALVFREIDLLEGRAVAPIVAGAAPAVAPAPAPVTPTAAPAPVAPSLAATGAPTTPPVAAQPVAWAPPTQPAPPAARPGGLSPQLVGALKGAAVVGVAFLLYVALSDKSGPRAPGQSMTGNDAVGRPTPQQVVAPAGGGGEAPAMGGGQDDGGGDMGGGQQARSLTPEVTPRLQAASERVEADPGSRDARVELGWALVEARGWIDVYHTAEDLLAADAEDADGLALAAAVRVAMGQRDGVAELLDRAIAKDPKNANAYAWRGRVAQLVGDEDGKAKYWTEARGLAPDKAAMDATIAGFEAAGTAPSRHPGPGEAPAQAQPADDGGTEAFEGGVSGTVKLAAGATPPAGAVLFLIARVPGAAGGPPAATRKIVSPTFPRAFTLGPSDVMMGGAFPESVTVQARLDSDGNPMTRDPSDLVASWPGEVQAGQRGIVLELAPGR